MPEIPGPGTNVSLLMSVEDLGTAVIARRLNNGTVILHECRGKNGTRLSYNRNYEIEAEAVIVYRHIRYVESENCQAETEVKSQPSLGEEHAESIEPAVEPSTSAESESKHQEDTPPKRTRRRARKLRDQKQS